MTATIRFARALTPILVIACGLDWRTPTLLAQEQQSAYLVLIDEDSIDHEQAPNQFPAADVNASIAQVGVRDALPAFLSKLGYHITLGTGQPGDEGWFALRSTPSSWISEDGSADGFKNFVLAGPGLGSPDEEGNRGSLLTAVSDVAPIGAAGLQALVGSSVCGVVYDHDVVIDGQTLAADLSGPNLGLVAFKVISVAADEGGLSLPDVEVEILDSVQTCGGTLVPFLAP